MKYENILTVLTIFFIATGVPFLTLLIINEKKKFKGKIIKFLYKTLSYSFILSLMLILLLMCFLLLIYTFRITLIILNSIFSSFLLSKVALYFSVVLTFLVIVYIPEYLAYVFMKLTKKFDDRSEKTYFLFKNFVRYVNLRIFVYGIAVFFAVIASLKNLDVNITLPFFNEELDQSITIEAVVTFLAIDSLFQMLLPQLKKWKEIFEKTN